MGEILVALGVALLLVAIVHGVLRGVARGLRAKRSERSSLVAQAQEKALRPTSVRFHAHSCKCGRCGGAS